jgi:hypothetical protein
MKTKNLPVSFIYKLNKKKRLLFEIVSSFKVFSFFFLFLFQSFAFAQTESDAQPRLSGQARVSVITCGPGPELYEAFGHSAIRVSDPLQSLDLVFNYGMFDFNQENFYGNFAKGSMRYMLGLSSFEDFMFQYKHYKRSVREQVLNLDSLERQAVVNYLSINLRPENKEYLYDYFYNNCSTKIIDLLDSAINRSINWELAQPEGKVSYRQLIYQYTVFQPWGRLGIDLGLGSPIDKPMTGKQLQFLPDGVEQDLTRAKIRRGLIEFPLVASSSVLYQSPVFFAADSFFISPAFVFSIIFLISLFLSFKRLEFSRLFRMWKGVLFLLAGVLGWVELLIWLFTNHKAAAWNFNLLWANPSFLFLGIIYLVLKKVGKTFQDILFFYLSFVLVFWFLLPQVLNINLLPFVVALWICQFPFAKMINNPNKTIEVGTV